MPDQFRGIYLLLLRPFWPARSGQTVCVFSFRDSQELEQLPVTLRQHQKVVRSRNRGKNSSFVFCLSSHSGQEQLSASTKAVISPVTPAVVFSFPFCGYAVCLLKLVPVSMFNVRVGGFPCFN